MNHAWRATGVFPYRRRDWTDTSENANRQVFICDNCGYETHRHEPPADDEKIHVKVEPNVSAYLTCEENVIFNVMDS